MDTTFRLVSRPKIEAIQKDSGTWKGINPHDCFTLVSGKKSGHLKGDLLHWIYRDYKEHNQKLNVFQKYCRRGLF